MKRRLFIILCYFFTIHSHAEVENNLDKKITNYKSKIYQGDSLVSKKKLVKTIDSTCLSVNPYESGKTQKEIDMEKKKCILSKITFNYSEIINQMVSNEKIYLSPINDINIFLKKTKTQIYPEDLNIEVRLFTELNNKIIDEIPLYYEKYNIESFYAESQYYFINNYIYILQVSHFEEGDWLKSWNKYSIDDNGKFNLQQSIKCTYKFENGKEKNICQ